MNEKQKQDITLFRDRAETLLVMPADVAGRVIQAILRHEQNNVFDFENGTISNNYQPPFASGSYEQIAYDAIIPGTENANKSWLKRIKQTTKAAAIRWNKSSNADAMQTHTASNARVMPISESVSVSDSNSVLNSQSVPRARETILELLTDDDYKKVESLCTNVRLVVDHITERAKLEEIKHPYNYFMTVAKELGAWKE